MAEFYVALSVEAMASQIAKMLNKHNRLYKSHTGWSVSNEPCKYFVEVVGDRVIACAGLVQEREDLSKIMHVCVEPEYRRRGLAKKLIQVALDNCKTMLIYMTIREDNRPSLRMAESMGFVKANQYWSKDHNVIIVGRKIK